MAGLKASVVSMLARLALVLAVTLPGPELHCMQIFSHPQDLFLPKVSGEKTASAQKRPLTFKVSPAATESCAMSFLSLPALPSEPVSDTWGQKTTHGCCLRSTPSAAALRHQWFPWRLEATEVFLTILCEVQTALVRKRVLPSKYITHRNMDVRRFLPRLFHFTWKLRSLFRSAICLSSLLKHRLR